MRRLTRARAPACLAGLAGAVSRTATAPIDRLKMLLQVQESQHLTLRQGLKIMASEGAPHARGAPAPRRPPHAAARGKRARCVRKGPGAAAASDWPLLNASRRRGCWRLFRRERAGVLQRQRHQRPQGRGCCCQRSVSWAVWCAGWRTFVCRRRRGPQAPRCWPLLLPHPAIAAAASWSGLTGVRRAALRHSAHLLVFVTTQHKAHLPTCKGMNTRAHTHTHTHTHTHARTHARTHTHTPARPRSRPRRA